MGCGASTATPAADKATNAETAYEAVESTAPKATLTATTESGFTLDDASKEAMNNRGSVNFIWVSVRIERPRARAPGELSAGIERVRLV